MKKKTKAVVLAKEGRYFSVLTEEGEFKRLKIRGEEISAGDEIFLEEETARKPFFSSFRWPVAATAVAIVLLMLLGVFGGSSPAAAYLAIDINPAIELGLDEEGKIVDFSASDEEGQKVIEAVNLKDLSWREGLQQILLSSKELGFLKAEGENEIFVSLIENKSGDITVVTTEEIENSLNAELSRLQCAGRVRIGKAGMEQREKAHGQGMSVNAYLLKEAARAKGFECNGCTTSEIMKELRQKGVDPLTFSEDISSENGSNGKSQNKGTAAAPKSSGSSGKGNREKP